MAIFWFSIHLSGPIHGEGWLSHIDEVAIVLEKGDKNIMDNGVIVDCIETVR